MSVICEHGNSAAVCRSCNERRIAALEAENARLLEAIEGQKALALYGYQVRDEENMRLREALRAILDLKGAPIECDWKAGVIASAALAEQKTKKEGV